MRRPLLLRSEKQAPRDRYQNLPKDTYHTLSDSNRQQHFISIHWPYSFKKWQAPLPPFGLSQPANLITHRSGAQFRKSPVNALPFSSTTSSIPRNTRHIPNPAPKSHNFNNLHPHLRKMARPSPEGNLSKSIKDPRTQSERFPNQGLE